MSDLRAGSPPLASSETPRRASGRSPQTNRGRWLWLIGSLVAAGLLIGGGTWWLLDSTVPASEYDAVVAELSGTRRLLAATEEILEDTEATLESTERALEVAQETVTDDEIRARFVEAEASALLLGYFVGADPEIVSGPAWSKTWPGVVELDMAVDAIDDPVLTDLYSTYLGGEYGDVIPTDDFVLLLIEHTIEPLLRGR